MPADVVGTNVFNMKARDFDFKQSPIFSNVVVIDEINRAPAKVQSALSYARCPECGDLARPNVLMFGDGGWLSDRTHAQARRFEAWLAALGGRRLVIVELGAGTHVPTVRWTSEKLARQHHGVLVRINRGQEQTALDYLDLLAARAALIERVSRRIADFDALAMPTAPIIAPRLVELETDEGYARINLLALRNPTVINMLDGCAISIPMQAQDEPPTGLMLATTAGRDHHLFRLAATIEAALETHLGG